MNSNDFIGDSEEYLIVQEEDLSEIGDTFIEKSVFQSEESKTLLQKSKVMGFDITFCANQFIPRSLRVAIECVVKSADRLEATSDI